MDNISFFCRKRGRKHPRGGKGKEKTHLGPRFLVFGPQRIDLVVDLDVVFQAQHLGVVLPQFVVDAAEGVSELQRAIGLIAALEKGQHAGEERVDGSQHGDGDARGVAVGGSQRCQGGADADL